MGRKRKTRKYTKRSQKKTNRVDLIIIILIAVSLLLAVLIYAKSGIIGIELSKVLGGLTGVMMYMIPIGTLIVALKLAIEEREDFKIKLIQYIVLLISMCIVISIFQIIKGELNIGNEMSENIDLAYNIGTTGKGGGAIGTVAAVPLVTLLGKVGAVILCIGITAVLAVFTFGISLSDIINNAYAKHLERKEERETEKQEYRKAKQISIEENVKENKRIMHNRKAIDQEMEPEQIKINFGGREVENAKYAHKQDDLVPLTRETKKLFGKNKEKLVEEVKESDPTYIESNLFKQEEHKKEESKKEVLQLEHAMVVEDEHYEYPPLEILSKGKTKGIKGGAKALTDTAAKLQKTLYSFGVSAKVENVTVGPAITRYELKPAEGVRVNKIANLADDIALNLAAQTIRIEAPIPGKQAVGIEVPNEQKEMVHLRDVLESDEFKNNKSKLSIALGKDVAGNSQLADVAKMPHVLIAGSTGSGKSVCINTIITSIIYNSKPSEVKMVMVDPKVVELSVYNGIPHLLIPVVTDPKKAAGALAWAVQEMDDRYEKFAGKGVRDLKGYNAAIEKEEESRILPQIVIIIDELADLMMVAAKEVEESICRLAQKARAAGMHLVIATQRPSVDVITGLIKANVPSRIAFAVSSQIDSRTILDSVGAEKLLGKGDMLYFPAGSPKPSRVQGAFVTDDEVEKIVDFIKSNGTATYSEDILESIENGNKQDKNISKDKDDDDDSDPFLMEAIDTVVETGQASTSFIQRKFKVGYARAGRIIDQMEERGVISGYQGSKPREVLMTMERLQELKMTTSDTEDK